MLGLVDVMVVSLPRSNCFDIFSRDFDLGRRSNLGMFGEVGNIFWTDEIVAAVTCQDKRGGLFHSNESTTWDYLGFYGLGWVILSQHLGPHWMQLAGPATCLGSICSEDILRTLHLCPREEMLTPKSYRLDPQLGFGGVGSYGLETVGFTDTFSAPSQIVGVINTTEYWVGYLGLGIEPTNFTDANQPTLLTSLVENQSLIPSHSYGYTAGAYYSKCVC